LQRPATVFGCVRVPAGGSAADLDDAAGGAGAAGVSGVEAEAFVHRDGADAGLGDGGDVAADAAVWV